MAAKRHLEVDARNFVATLLSTVAIDLLLIGHNIDAFY